MEEDLLKKLLREQEEEINVLRGQCTKLFQELERQEEEKQRLTHLLLQKRNIERKGEGGREDEEKPLVDKQFLE